MRVALAHDFLMQMGGGEKVLEVLHDMFPDAPVYTSAYDPSAMPAHYRSWDIRTSFLQSMWMKRKLHRVALPLYPLAFEGFDFSPYDLVISSSSAFAKGILTPPDTHHLCYTHAPMRYAWDTGMYARREKMGGMARMLLTPLAHYLRTWDAVASTRVDTYIANSTTVAKRIDKYYRRASRVINPPVDTGRFSISREVDDYYIVVSRMIPYKRLDLAIDAFGKLGIPLKVVGSGRQFKALSANAASCVQFLGQVSDRELPGLLSRSKGFIMPGEEDFGIAPVEANACGRPVIAYGAGGALDSQVDGLTGILFEEQTVESLCDAVQCAEKTHFDPEAIRRHSQQFSIANFQDHMHEAILRTNCQIKPHLHAVIQQQEIPIALAQ